MESEFYLLERRCAAAPTDATNSPRTASANQPHWTPSAEKLLARVITIPATNNRNPIRFRIPPKKIASTWVRNLIIAYLHLCYNMRTSLVGLRGLEPLWARRPTVFQALPVCQFQHSPVDEGKLSLPLIRPPSSVIIVVVDRMVTTPSQTSSVSMPRVPTIKRRKPRVYHRRRRRMPARARHSLRVHQTLSSVR